MATLTLTWQCRTTPRTTEQTISGQDQHHIKPFGRHPADRLLCRVRCRVMCRIPNSTRPPTVRPTVFVLSQVEALSLGLSLTASSTLLLSILASQLPQPCQDRLLYGISIVVCDRPVCCALSILSRRQIVLEKGENIWQYFALFAFMKFQQPIALRQLTECLRRWN